MAVTIQEILNGRYAGDIEPQYVEGAFEGFEKVNSNFTNLKVEVDSLILAPTSHTHPWVDITSTPTTMSGFGISDSKANFSIALSDGTFMFVGDAPTSHTHVEADITDFGTYSVVGHVHTASVITIATGGGSPTIDQIQEYFDNTGSSGFFLGGALSDGGAGTLDGAVGSGFIRATNDPNAELQSFKWSAFSGMAVPDNTTQYVYVDDAGAISLSTNEFLEAPDLLLIGVVTKEAGAIESVFSLGVRLEEGIGQAGRFIRRVHGVTRDKRRGGLIFGQSGDANRDVTMSPGVLWWGRTEYPITDFNTSGADTFATYSAAGQEDAVASQWPNEQYDNSGTLTTMTNNRWANLFFYIEPDDHIVMVYGRAEFTKQSLAELEATPSTSLPTRITETGIEAARFTFQKADNTATIAINVDFIKVFVGAGVTDHVNLSNVGANTHAQIDVLMAAINASAATGLIVTVDDTGVGIGTTSPDFMLDIEGSAALGKMKRFNAVAPDRSPAFLFVRARGTQGSPADIVAGDWLGKVQFRGFVSSDIEYGALAAIAKDTSGNARISFVAKNLATEHFSVDLETGNVGIGITSPGYLLSFGTPSGKVLSLFEGASVQFYGFGLGANQLEIFAQNSDQDPKIVIKASGDVIIKTGNLVIGTAGKGIDFSATSDATGSTSELFDDYEEGDITTTLIGSISGDWTLQNTRDSLAYTKSGRVVTIKGRIRATADNSGSGGLRVAVPYVVATLTDDQNSGGWMSIKEHGGTIDNPYVFPIEGQAYIDLYKVTAAGVESAITQSDVDDAFYIIFDFTYIAA